MKKTQNLKNSIKPCVDELERFYQFVNKEYGLKLPDQIVITIQTRGKRNALGWFFPEKWTNGKGTVNEINISAEDLTKGNPYETISHEVAHYKNYVEKVKDCSKNQYHNKKFRDRAESLDLEVKKSGHYGYAFTKPTEVWEKQLKKFKPDKNAFVLFRNSVGTKEKAPTKMKLWECSCGVKVRCAVELNAVCKDCETPFVKQEDN